jgi:carbon-monoxide dehydrogenase medium subunit
MDEALAVLAETGRQGRVLAGGQSLIPLMNRRLLAPDHLVDINGIRELADIRVEDGGVRVGATARQSTVEREVAVTLPLLRHALGQISHAAVRNRATVVGSLAHADPRAELPAVLALLEGTVEIARQGGGRTVPAVRFFLGPWQTSLAPDELVVSAFFPRPGTRTGTSIAEVSPRRGDLALCGAAAAVTLDDDRRVASARTVLFAVARTPVVLDLTEAVSGAPVDQAEWANLAGLAQTRLVPESSLHATAEYRRSLVGVLTARVLRSAAAQAVAVDGRAQEGAG